MEPIEAFEWLLAEFQLYMHGKTNWLHVKKVLAEAREHSARFKAESVLPEEGPTSNE